MAGVTRLKVRWLVGDKVGTEPDLSDSIAQVPSAARWLVLGDQGQRTGLSEREGAA